MEYHKFKMRTYICKGNMSEEDVKREESSPTIFNDTEDEEHYYNVTRNGQPLVKIINNVVHAAHYTVPIKREKREDYYCHVCLLILCSKEAVEKHLEICPNLREVPISSFSRFKPTFYDKFGERRKCWECKMKLGVLWIKNKEKLFKVCCEDCFKKEGDVVEIQHFE